MLFVAFELGAWVDTAVPTEQPREVASGSWVLFHREERGECLGGVCRVLENRPRQGATLEPGELSVGKSQSIERVFVVQELI